MDQSLHTYMRVGLLPTVPAASRHLPAFLRSIEALAADTFFSAVELGRLPDDGARARVAAALRVTQLASVYEVRMYPHEPDLALCSADNMVRQHGLAAARRAIDEAAEIGAERINVPSGRDPGVDGRDAGADALVDSLYELAAYTLNRAGPALALKPFPRRGKHGALIGPTAEAVGLVRLVREVYPDVGLSLETGHLALLGEAMPAAFALAAPHLQQVGVTPARTRTGNNRRYDVAHLYDTLLALFRVGFLGGGWRPLVLFHAAPRSGQNMAEVIAELQETLGKAWANL